MTRLISLLGILIATNVNAQEITFNLGDERIPIWKSDQSREDGRKIIDSKIRDSSLLLPLLSCVPKGDAKAVVMDGKPFSPSKRVLITTGESKGCEGYVESFYLPLDAR